MQKPCFFFAQGGSVSEQDINWKDLFETMPRTRPRRSARLLTLELTLESLPDAVLRIVLEFATHTLLQVLKLQCVNKYFRRAVRQSNKLWHVNVQVDDFQELRRLGAMTEGIRTLTVRRAPRLGDFASWLGLRSLDISYGTFTAEHFDLSGLTHLRSLQIEFCSKLQHVAGLPPSLHELNARGCTNLVSLPGTLPSLVRLNVKHCHRLSRIPWAPLLSALDVVQCPASLGPLPLLCAIKACQEDHYQWATYSSLHTLKLIECTCSNTDFLASLAKLTTLSLKMPKTHLVFDLTGVSALSQLENLELEGPVTNEHLRNLETLGRLRSLVLCSSKMTDEGMRSVAKLQALTALGLSCSFASGFSHLGLRYLALPHLKTMNLFGCDIVDLEPLEGLASLETLVVFSSYRLHDLRHVSNFPQLRTLKLAFCDAVTGLGGVNQAPALTTLDVSHCWDLKREGMWSLFPCKLSELVLNAHARAQLGDEVPEFHRRLTAGNPHAKLIF